MAGKGTLFVVATPIGNRDDLSPRAVDTLRAAAVVAAEDTRHSGALLKTLGIDRPLVALHEHNERDRAGAIVARLLAGDDVALVSDAGTPLVSDPGYRLVRAAIDAGITVVPVPGACALVAALSVAGLPTDRFCFEGFLPAKRTARQGALAALAADPRTLVFYEAPHRIVETLEDAASSLGPDRAACVARELTKAFETVYHGTLAELATRAAADPNVARGEIVLVIAGAPATDDAEADRALDRALGVLLPLLPASQAADAAAQLTGSARNRAYRRAQQLKAGSDPVG